MLTSLVAEKASGSTAAQYLAQERGLGWWKHRAWDAVAQAQHHPMAKSNPVKETKIADPVEPARRQPRATVKKAGGTAKAQNRRTRRKGAVGSRNGAKPASGKQTKQQTCLDLLGRREGATIEDLEEATGWQKHSVRVPRTRSMAGSSASIAGTRTTARTRAWTPISSISTIAGRWCSTR